MDYAALAQSIKAWGSELGFQAVGIADADLSAAEPRLLEWLAQGWHGEMEYMARHGALRARPAELKARHAAGDLLPDELRSDLPEPRDFVRPKQAVIARYARGRDYHKVLRDRLQKLCDRIAAEAGPFGHRVFTDSAPVMEVELARARGLGWRGKHTLLLSRDAGSWFFLGEIYCDLPLPVDQEEKNSLRNLRALHRHLPDAGDPRALPARRAALHLLPHHRAQERDPRGAAAADRQPRLRLRRLPGWFVPGTASRSRPEEGFRSRETAWTARRWSSCSPGPKPSSTSACSGSPIRRIGYERWLRNLAVGLGNAPTSPEVVKALQSRKNDRSPLVKEHIEWALARHERLAA